MPEDPAAAAEPLVVDVIAWPSADRQEAERRLEQIRRVVEHHEGEEIAFDARARYTVLRARVSGVGLADLLDLAVVERTRTPPVAYLEPSDWLAASLEDLAIEAEPGVAIGVIDDAIAAHPLLDGTCGKPPFLPRQP